MNKVSILIAAILLTIIHSCSFFEKDKEKFIDTYREIVIIREMYTDTSKVNKEINKLFEKNGYDWDSFTDDYYSFVENPQEFLEIMDSVRERNQRELVKFRKK